MVNKEKEVKKRLGNIVDEFIDIDKLVGNYYSTNDDNEEYTSVHEFDGLREMGAIYLHKNGKFYRINVSEDTVE